VQEIHPLYLLLKEILEVMEQTLDQVLLVEVVELQQ
jgi:hypothetical protein